MAKCSALVLAVSLCHSCTRAWAAGFSLSALTTSGTKLDLGPFPGGALLSLQMGGQIRLLEGDAWITQPDGSVLNTIALPQYRYANQGAAGYPTAHGGDGTNHFCGGGANFDISLGEFGPAGARTTDTTARQAIRFGAVIGTFRSKPTREDWFLVGYSHVVRVPRGGAHFYLAVQDTTYPNNSGSYVGTVSVVQPP